MCSKPPTSKCLFVFGSFFFGSLEDEVTRSALPTLVSRLNSLSAARALTPPGTWPHLARSHRHGRRPSPALRHAPLRRGRCPSMHWPSSEAPGNRRLWDFGINMDKHIITIIIIIYHHHNNNTYKHSMRGQRDPKDPLKIHIWATT